MKVDMTVLRGNDHIRNIFEDTKGVIGVYAGAVKWIVKTRFLFQTVYVMWFTHTNMIVRGFVCRVDNMEVRQVAVK